MLHSDLTDSALTDLVVLSKIQNLKSHLGDVFLKYPNYSKHTSDIYMYEFLNYAPAYGMVSSFKNYKLADTLVVPTIYNKVLRDVFQLNEKSPLFFFSRYVFLRHERLAMEFFNYANRDLVFVRSTGRKLKN